MVLDLRTLTTVTDFFVVCTAGSARQLGALKDHLEAVLDGQGYPVWHIEGTSTARKAVTRFPDEPQWVLIDVGDLVIHLLDQRARDFYRLEDLWADAPRIPLASQAPRSAQGA